MKTRMTLGCLLLSVMCLAQNFEGVIKWSMTNEITDLKLKAQMAEAQKKMNDPATQAQMKEMEEKMNDPQFKAMMESNPQMKAQMENAMKMMQGGDMGSMMPTGFTLKVKDGNSLIKMEGGMMSGTETLYLKDKNQSYLINRESKTYTVLPHYDEQSKAVNDNVKVTKTSETQKILNYNCTKTIVTVTEGGKSINQIFWTTTEIKNLDFKSLSSQKVGKGTHTMFYNSIEGVPLKTEMITPECLLPTDFNTPKFSTCSLAIVVPQKAWLKFPHLHCGR